MLCGSWIRLSRCQRKRSRLLPRPSKRLIQLGSPGCVGKKKVYFSAAATSKGGKDGDEPPALPACPDGAPGPASLPAAWPGVCGGQRPLPGRGGPAARVPGPGHPRATTGAHGARARHKRDGSTRAGSDSRAGDEPRTRERGHRQCEPTADGDPSVCLSVGHRAWRATLTGCQAIPLRGQLLLLLEGKVWPFLLMSEACLASLRNKLLPKAMASEEMFSPKAAVEQQGDPVPLQLGMQHKRAS